MKIVIATLKSWNIKNCKRLKKLYPKIDFYCINSNEQLNFEFLDSIVPTYIFFPHWSFVIPKEIYEKYTCIVFHMSDLPYGRGGSPLQNLILCDIKKTKICALKVNGGIDAGDIYYKKTLNIAKGSAKKIYKKASKIIFFKMIPTFFQKSLNPIPQSGDVTLFKRRNPKQSDLTTLQKFNLSGLYDFIRMLDAPSYPKAFLDFHCFRVEFSSVKRKNKKLIGRFKVYEK